MEKITFFRMVRELKFVVIKKYGQYCLKQRKRTASENSGQSFCIEDLKSIVRFTLSCLAERQQRQRRKRRPSGCCPYRSDPSFRRVQERKKILRTERRNAYGPWYRSCRSLQGLPPCYRGAGFCPCRRPKQRRNISCRFRRPISYRCRQRGAGILSGWWSYR